MQKPVKLLGVVKVDKLSFGINNTNPDLSEQIDAVIEKYYEEYFPLDNYNKLKRTLTPTKQRREGYEEFNHNLQMIPLPLFLRFLKELRFVASQDLNVYEIHLAMDILLEDASLNYLKDIHDHEYPNGYKADYEEADSEYTVYISRKQDLDSNNELKLKIKFYDKAKELLYRHKEELYKEKYLPLKEPIDEPDLSTEIIDGRMYLCLKGLETLRCEMELREKYLPYHTIDQMIEALNNGSFQDKIEAHYKAILDKVVFATPTPKAECSKLKEIAINLMQKSDRNYNTLFVNAGMSREYRYFRPTKEAVTREDDPLFEELRRKLVGE